MPVHNKQSLIKSVLIKKDVKRKGISWNEEILKDIKNNYEKTPYFEEYFPYIKEILINNHDKLITLNMKLIYFLMDIFGVKTKIILASELGLKSTGNSSEDIANICDVLGGDLYLSGNGGENYLDLNIFKGSGIKVEFQEYNHPVYPQKYAGFIPNLASIDPLFCIGPDIFNKSIIKPYKKAIKC